MQPVLLITGASRGIGAATARLAAERGHAVCVNYRRDETGAQALVREIEVGGGRAIAVQADVAIEADVVRLFETVDAQWGPFSVLFNLGGVRGRRGLGLHLAAPRLARIFATNVTGAFVCAREAVRRMSTRHGGRGGAIVNVSSIAARLGAPGEYVDYAASKGALDTLTLGLAREVAAEGIRVNAVRPGLIHTGIHADGGEPGRVERIAPSLPMGRGGTPEEVAQAILWLLSEEASYATGSFIELGGGR